MVANWESIIGTMKLFTITPQTQKQCDQRYRLCLGPVDFVDINTLYFQHTGTVTIHLAQVFWCTDVGKYILYNAIHPALYSVIAGVSDIFRHLTASEIDVDQLRRFRVRMVEIMSNYEKIIPPTDHHVLFHDLHHVYASVLWAGPVRYFWMYVWERLNARLKRMIHSRVNPEANIMKSVLKEESAGVVGDLFFGKMESSFQSSIGQKILSFLGRNPDSADSETAPVKWPKRFRKNTRYKPVHTLTKRTKDAFISMGLGQDRLKVWEVLKKIRVNGVMRTAWNHEPSFPRIHRRLSGFRISSDKVGRILRILNVNGEGVVEYDIFSQRSHGPSALFLVDKKVDTTKFMLARDLTSHVVMFLPFVETPESWCVIDTILS